MWALALIALLAGAPSPEWLRGPPRAIGPTTLVGAGEDGGLGVLVQAGTLVAWDFDSGKAKRTARLPAGQQKWTVLAVAPRTSGETERAVVGGDKRLALVHLRSGRLIGNWAVPSNFWVASRAVTWAPDGARVALVGWELPGLQIVDTTGVPVLWVDAETGTVVSQLRLPDAVPEVHGAAALADGRSIALGTPKRVIVLGPGPSDARTIGIDNDGVVGATRDGIVVLKKGALVVIDRASGSKASETLKVRAPVDLTDLHDVAMLPGGRWAVARARGGVFAIDLSKGKVTTLSEVALGGAGAAVVPTLGGVAVVGRKSARLDLTVGAPEALLLERMCLRGDCRIGDGARVDLASGEQYSGAFRAGEPSGQGVLKYADGSIYTGPFVKGRPHGDGKMLMRDGDEKRVRAVDGKITVL